MNNTTTFTVCYETEEAIHHGQFESRRMETLPATFATVREAIDAAKPFAMADRRTSIDCTPFTQTAKFRKGSAAFWVRSHSIMEITIRSWGRVQGTATSNENGEFTRHQFRTATTPVFGTRAEAEAFAAATHPAAEFNSLSGSLDCALSVSDRIGAAYRAGHEAKINELRQLIANF